MTENFIEGFKINWDKIENDSFLRGLAAIKNLKTLQFNKNVTFFSGENGSGKSTVLEALAVNAGFNPEGGSKNYNFSTFDSTSRLQDAVTLIKSWRKPAWGYFLRAESFYNVATKEMEYSDFRHPSMNYHQQSHGESFLSMAQVNLKSNGIYFLDEPEAALSPQRQLTLLLEIKESAENGSQFIIATQSPILLGLPDSEILSFSEHGILPCRYEETESYQITKMFVNNRDKILKELFEG